MNFKFQTSFNKESYNKAKKKTNKPNKPIKQSAMPVTLEGAGRPPGIVEIPNTTEKPSFDEESTLKSIETQVVSDTQSEDNGMYG